MTIEEYQIVKEIIHTADSGCSCCVSRLLDHFKELFPEFDWTQNENLLKNNIFKQIDYDEYYGSIKEYLKASDYVLQKHPVIQFYLKKHENPN